MAIRHYKITLEAVGPVHIGNGRKYGSKDYFSSGKRVAVLDVSKFIEKLGQKQLGDYCAFLEKDSRNNLQDFLDGDASLMAAANAAVAYWIDTPLATARRGSLQYFDVAEFVKDIYGCPYVPGSSVKGMLRTAILTSIVLNNRDSYAALFNRAAVRDEKRRKDADKRIAKKAFWRERPDPHDVNVVNDIMRYVSVSDSHPLSTDDLVFVKKYDKFAKTDDGCHKKNLGRISDTAYYEGNALNIYRECLKPGTRIELALNIDDRIDEYLAPLKLDLDGLRAILVHSFELYSRCFLRHFNSGGNTEDGADAAAVEDGTCQYVMTSGPLAGRRCRNKAVDGTGYCNTHIDQANATGNQDGCLLVGKELVCILGGGTDFDCKTVVNALFDDDLDRLTEISHILYSQFSTRLDPSKHSRLQEDVREAGYYPKIMKADYRNGRLKKAKNDHRHWRDVELGVSPHTMKFGILGSKKYPMGKCSVKIEELR